MKSACIFLMILMIKWHLPVVFGASDGDDLELVALLLKDEQYDQAQEILERMDLAVEKDLATYYQMRGMIKSHFQDFGGAIEAFDRSFQHGQTNLLLHLYLAQAHLALAHFSLASEHLQQSGAIGKQQALYYLLLDQYHQKQGQWPQALRVLQSGLTQFPTNLTLQQAVIRFYVNQGLLQAALQASGELLQQHSTPTDFAQLAQIFQQGKHPLSAISILERGKLSHPASESIILPLVQIYYQLKKPLIAGQILENYALLRPQFYPEAAELYQQAGQRDYALYLNTRIVDEKKKYQQRLGFFLVQEKFEQITQMEKTLQKHQVLANDESKYALAYCFFKIGNFVKMEEYLGQLTKDELFAKALQMRKSVESCQEQAWACF